MKIFSISLLFTALPVSVPLPGHPTWRPQSLRPLRRWRWGFEPWCWPGCPWRTRRRLTPASLAHWDPFASSSLVFWVSLRCPLQQAAFLPAKMQQRQTKIQRVCRQEGRKDESIHIWSRNSLINKMMKLKQKIKLNRLSS